MARSGPRKVRKYSGEFKFTAVRLSQQPGLLVQTVAAALEIHPFMLFNWRKEARWRSSADFGRNGIVYLMLRGRRQLVREAWRAQRTVADIRHHQSRRAFAVDHC